MFVYQRIDEILHPAELALKKNTAIVANAVIVIRMIFRLGIDIGLIVFCCIGFHRDLF